MRKDLLIASLIILLLGLAISGVFGTILLTVGILLLLYVLFSRESPREAEAARYVEPDYNRETTPKSKKDTTVKYVEEPKPRYKNVNKAERELRAWGSGNRVKNCPACGSTNNPPNAKFCADCGKKL